MVEFVPPPPPPPQEGDGSVDIPADAHMLWWRLGDSKLGVGSPMGQLRHRVAVFASAIDEEAGGFVVPEAA